MNVQALGDEYVICVHSEMLLYLTKLLLVIYGV